MRGPFNSNGNIVNRTISDGNISFNEIEIRYEIMFTYDYEG